MTGYVTASQFTMSQIKKDEELLNSGEVSSVTWHFFTSPQTGRIGASPAVMNALKKAGIQVIFHP